MGVIQYMEKPDWVSWENVMNCIREAHQSNKKFGFEMLNSKQPANDFSKRLKSGHCFVALDGERVVGTLSVLFLKKKKWWTRGPIVYHCYDAILPDYRGTDVYFGLNDLRDKVVLESGIKIEQFNTAEKNKIVIKINKKYGYKLVQFSPTGKGADYYSVTMVRWNDGCPFPDWFIKFMFVFSKIVSKTLWKPGYKWRFWFN